MIWTISGTHETTVGQHIAAHWKQKANSPLSPPYSAIGWVKDGCLFAQCVFFDYQGSNIEAHFQCDEGYYGRKILKDIMEYVFKQLKCNRLTAKVKIDNKKFLALLPRLGFEYECTQEAYYGTADNPIDSVVFKLTKDKAQRWL